MIRFVTINGRRVPAPTAPAPVAYTSALSNMVREIESLYLEALGLPHPATRHDSGLVQRLLGNRPALVRLLQSTDRARGLTEHGLSLAIDGVMEYFGFNHLVDQFGRAVIGEANRGFDKLVDTVADGRKVKASIYAIDHRAKTSDMSRFIDGFRRKNTGLIRKLIGEQVVRTEQVVSENYGEHVEVLAQRIQQATGTTESHAELLARDQTLKTNADVQRFRAQSLGADYYIWVTSNDERVRGRPGGKWANAQSNHWRLHGKRFAFNDPPTTNEKRGEKNNPGMDYQCRCTATPDLSHIFD